MPSPICRLIHISDPHFGPQFVIDGESYWRSVIARIPGISHLTGLYPHSYQWAGALAVAVRTILRDSREAGIPATVVHTGDLTASGRQAEFSVGRTFLSHGHYLENGEISGLRLDTEFHQLPFDIPGNHDFWHGSSPKDRNAFDSHYGGAYPRTKVIENANGKVILYGLDSNRSSKWQHRLANGEIPAEALSSVCDGLHNHKASGAIQVVCLHHPLFLRPRTVPRMARKEILQLKNRTAIARQLADCGAQIALAGHVHRQQHPFRGRSKPLHFIAGSACQIRTRPSFWTLDVFQKYVEYAYFQIPRWGLQFVPAISRSGASNYR